MCRSALLVVSLLIASIAQGATVLSYKSDPGDPIGYGHQGTITSSSTYEFVLTKNAHDGASLQINYHYSWIEYVFSTTNFSAPYDAPLQVGTYANVEMYPPANPDAAGLLGHSGDADPSNNPCSSVSGWFRVREIEYSADGTGIVKLAVDYRQQCNGLAAGFFASLRVNSDVPVMTAPTAKIVVDTPLNPSRCVEAESAAGASVAMHVDKDLLYPDVNYEYQWSANGGEMVHGESFSLDLGLDESASIQLIVKDLDTGTQYSDSRSVCVSDTTPPEVVITSPQPGDVFVGNNPVDVSVFDTVDGEIDTCELFVGYSRILNLDAYGEAHEELFKPAKDAGPATTEITVKAVDASGNVGSATVEVLQGHDKSGD